MFVTIRKSQKKSGTFSVNDQKINEQELVTLKNEFEFLQSKFKLSQDANEKLKSLYEDAVQETEENHRHIEYLETELSNVNEKLSETKADIDLIVTKKVKHISDEKRGIQVKHEKLCAEFKLLRQEKDDMQKDLNNATMAIKSSKKESQENFRKFEKQKFELESKIEKLTEFRLMKLGEEKELRTKLKKVDKKFKLLKEREANIQLQKNKENRNELDCNKNYRKVIVEKSEPFAQEVDIKFSEPSCNHIPQCSLRQPFPPPFGPLTYRQFDLQEGITAKEDKLVEIDSIADIKPVEKVEEFEPAEKEGVKKKNYMSKEQEKEFLKQFETALKTAFPETYANFSFEKDSTS